MKTIIKQGDKLVEVEIEATGERLTILNSREYKDCSNGRDEELVILEAKMKKLQSRPNFQAGIDFYNINRPEEEPKLTKRVIAGIIMPDKTYNSAVTYMSQWENGNELSAYRVWYGIRFCKLTGYPFEKLHNFDGIL